MKPADLREGRKESDEYEVGMKITIKVTKREAEE